MAVRSLKSLERAWRRVWIAVLTRLLAQPRRGGRPWPPGRDGRPYRVLFLRPDRIGDMIVSTGLLRAIARAHPAIRLDVLASPANAPVVRRDPHVAEVLTVDVRRPWRSIGLVPRLRAARYDAVVDCMPTAPSVTTLLLMLAVGARDRVGVAGRGNDAALTIAVPPRREAGHIIDHLASLAAAFDVDVEATDFSPALTLAPEELARADARWGARPAGGRPLRLLVNVSAGKAARRWPDASFVEVLRGVRTRYPDARVVLIGAPGERERAAAIADAAGVEPATTDALREALALVAAADVVLTPDTGLAHAACAFRKPTVDLLLRGRAHGWGLYRTPGHSIESPGDTLASLPAAPVLAALVQLLRSLEPVVEPRAPDPRATTATPGAESMGDIDGRR